MSTIYDKISDYFSNLNATSTICTEAGTTFTLGTNLFTYTEPPDTNSTTLTILPYSAGPPTPEGDRQEAGVHIRLKAKSRHGCFETQQAIINALHGNTSVCASTNSKLRAVQSVPIPMGETEGGEYKIVVSNFIAKYIKL